MKIDNKSNKRSSSEWINVERSREIRQWIKLVADSVIMVFSIDNALNGGKMTNRLLEALNKKTKKSTTKSCEEDGTNNHE